MRRNWLYYQVKPWVPWRLRLAVRRPWIRRKLRTCGDVWPIKEAAAHQPKGWRGWPDGKRFALVLTHDVEGQTGLQRCETLAALESRLGFRSSFNLVPEGEYSPPAELRERLASRGFEVGVHDLFHDGKLYQSRRHFQSCARRINRYLASWQAVGFRSGFMHHNLDWLGDLEILYDTSTFDTDPFEPQPDGVETIFPFWVPNARGGGYIELPYTLPQDSTLFLLLQEKGIEIWKRKLEWIARHGGMALVNVHPDYVNFGAGPASFSEFPAAFYESFLKHVTERYDGTYWNGVPREVATWCRDGQSTVPRVLVRVPAATPASAGLQGKRAAVVLYSYYPSDPRPRREAEALVRAGMRVDLICLREHPAEPMQETINGVHVRRVPLRRRRASKATYVVQYSWFLLLSLTVLARRSLRVRYHLVHVHNMPDFLVFSALAPRLRGARVLLDLHDPMPELFESIYGLRPGHWIVRLLQRLERCSLGFADLALTPNRAFRNLFVARGCAPEKMQIVMNSPQTQIFSPARFVTSPPPPPGPRLFTLMYHGLLVERHGLDLAVEAVALLRPRIPGLRFHIYGGRTPYVDQIERQIHRLGVADLITYQGPKPLEAIAEAISKIDLGLVPNRRSPFTEINMPTRIFEYLALGKPVIVPPTQGIRDYFTEGEIFFFEPETAAALAEKIAWVHRHPAETQTVVQRGRRIYETHCWEREEEHLVSLVQSLVH